MARVECELTYVFVLQKINSGNFGNIKNLLKKDLSLSKKKSTETIEKCENVIIFI